jgi:2-dehydro-3-deoxyphosphooctonate aldolase (KDO 8-P synthase)
MANSRPSRITITCGTFRIGEGYPLALIAGPCVIESYHILEKCARSLKEVAEKLNLPVLFKSSYDKANRLSLNSYRGPGLEEGLKMLAQLKKDSGLSVITDVHCVSQVEKVAPVVDALQVPAFLCRQTDLVVECARSGKPVNIKKGQFMSPSEMAHLVEKARSTGNASIMLTERGTFFGYGNLVNDMRSIPIMQRTDCPVIFDATHSVQRPGGLGNRSTGEREMIWPLAAAAVAAGADGIFLEVHPDPDQALCDGPNSLPLEELPPLVERLLRIKRALLQTQESAQPVAE